MSQKRRPGLLRLERTNALPLQLTPAERKGAVALFLAVEEFLNVTAGISHIRDEWNRLYDALGDRA